MDSERRRHKRVDIRLSASIGTRTDDPRVSIPTVVILDLSLGGAYCEVDRYVEPLTKVLLTIDFETRGEVEPHGETAVCRGVVVRTEPETAEADRYRMGILFTEISRPDKEKLQRFLADRVDDRES